jgi:hypothetical protein
MAIFKTSRSRAGAAVVAQSHQDRPAAVDNFQHRVRRKDRDALGRDATAGFLRCTWHHTDEGDLSCTWNLIRLE